jgi:hypothetical protein
VQIHLHHQINQLFLFFYLAHHIVIFELGEVVDLLFVMLDKFSADWLNLFHL